MAAHPIGLERDPLFDVIAVPVGDTRFRVFVPDESALSGVEFAIVLRAHTLIQDYFGRPISQVKVPRCLETRLCGRAVKLYGITEDEAFEDFRRAFRIEDRDLIVPVVKNTELAVVIDQYIVTQLECVFHRSCPKLPPNYVRPQKPTSELTEEESDLIELEETVQTVERLKKRCFPLMKPALKPLELFAVLQDVPQGLLGSFVTVTHLLEKRINIFRTIIASSEEIDNVSAYTGLDTIQFVLGEEMLKRVKSVLPIIWKLPRDQVRRVNRFVECKVQELTERTPIGSKKAPSQRESELADQIREPFSQFVYVKDYYLKPEFLPVLLKLVKTPLSPYPRVETVKEAFETYVAVEKLLHYSTDKLFRLLAWAKQKPPRIREQIVTQLEEINSWREVERILRQYNFPDEQYTEQEREIFVFFFRTLLSVENELLMCIVPPFLDDEIEDVLSLIVDAVASEQEEVCVLLEDYEPTPWDQLVEIEMQAKNTLERICSGAKIRLVYRPLWGGREVEIGALEMENEDFQKYYRPFQKFLR